MHLDQHHLKLVAVVQEKSVYHTKLLLLVQVPSSQAPALFGKSAIPVLLVTIVMQFQRHLLQLVIMLLEVQVHKLNARLTTSVLIKQGVHKPALVAFNQQLDSQHVPLQPLVILHLLLLAVLGITEEAVIQMVALFALLAFTVLVLQMLSLLFVEQAHIQVPQEQLHALAVLLEATV